MIISAKNLFVDGAFRGPGGLRLANGRIAEIFSGDVPGEVRLETGFLGPGLIDLHNNGAFGVDWAVATPAEWDSCLAALAARGVTAVLPTIITAPMPELAESAARVRGAMARHPALLGLHLEGPFLSQAKRGAHAAACLRDPEPALLAEIFGWKVVRVITMAPELPGAPAAIRQCEAAGIAVSLGHSAGDAEIFRRAAEAGATLVTHVFNAMTGIGHRAPGAAGMALTDPRLHPCLITDGVHVDPTVLALAFAACPRAIAVTDSILLAGLEPGAERQFGGAPARLDARGVGVRADGTIAGAGITLDEGVRRLVAAGIPAETAFAAATSRPADALGLADRGRIAVGARADLVWWDENFCARQVWMAGQTGPSPVAPCGTEAVRPEFHDLDERGTAEIVRAFLTQEAAAQRALAEAADTLAALADAVAARLAAGGRLFYAGAGTSGRLGLLDAVECGPTFGVGEEMVVPILAGGSQAFIQAVEGAEDDEAAAVAALKAHGLRAADAVVGIAASGSTPFTCAALRYARQTGACTGAIVNNDGRLTEFAEICVRIASGPEVIAGSTRLSAGTTQKIALNVLSSTVMIRLGKVHGPYMVDMRATNAKLRRRAVKMVMAIAKVDEEAAAAALAECGGQVKPAAAKLILGIGAGEAADRLQAAGGVLRKVLGTKAHGGLFYKL